jgi:tRNA threonylcarbamoyladenosine biosynthesis protein TsaE
MAAAPAIASACIELDGPLGAGKTTFARHLLAALGAEGRIKSPTFAIMEPYELASPHGPLAVSHFDFYRFTDPQEWLDAGFREVFAAPGLKLCEWAELAGPLRAPADLRVTLAFSARDDAERHVTLEAFTATGLALLPRRAAPDDAENAAPMTAP